MFSKIILFVFKHEGIIIIVDRACQVNAVKKYFLNLDIN